MEIVTRAQWDARPPRYVNALVLSEVNKFVLHYSGEIREQTVRSIQDHCMDNKGHSDIDYNDLVRGRKRYRGRGWNKGGHTLNNNSSSYGVCIIGRDGDATDEDMLTVLEIYDEVCEVLGRRITFTDHRGVLGDSYTSCPGNELHQWVLRGAPIPTGGIEMLKDEMLRLPKEQLVTGEIVPPTGDIETVDAATALAFALRHGYAARRAAEEALIMARTTHTIMIRVLEKLDELLPAGQLPDSVQLHVPAHVVTMNINPEGE